MEKFKVIYFGTWGYGRAGLEGLLRSNHVDIIKVFTKWDPDHNDQYMDQVRLLAEENNIACVNTNRKLLSKDEFNKTVLSQRKPDFVLSCCYDRIFVDDVINFSKIKSMNVHPSLLPKYRGIKPLENAIVKGEKETGITLHELTKELDAGRVLIQKGNINISEEDTYENLYKRQCEVISQVIQEFFASPFAFLNNPIIQDESKASQAPRLSFTIDNDMIVREIINMYQKNKANR